MSQNNGAPSYTRITGPLSVTGAVNQPFSYSIVLSPSARKYSTGTLPAGLTLNTTTGVISGTPTATGVTAVPIMASVNPTAPLTPADTILTINILPDAVANSYPPIIRADSSTANPASLAVDAAGNSYVARTFNASADFNTGIGVDAKANADGNDVAITRYNADGSYAWTQTFGGSGDDRVNAVTLSPDGATLYVAGSFRSIDARIGNGSVVFTSTGGADAYVLALNTADGSAKTAFGTSGLKTLTGAKDEIATCVTASATTVYVGGNFTSASVQVGGAGSALAGTGTQTAYILALDATTGAAVTTFGMLSTGIQEMTGSGAQTVADLKTTANSLFVCGSFNSPNLQIGGTGTAIPTAGQDDVFVASLSTADGSAQVAFGTGGIQTFGGTGMDDANAMTLATNQIYVTGGFQGTAKIAGNSNTVTAPGTTSVFALGLSQSTGAGLAGFNGTTGVQFAGGTGSDVGLGITTLGNLTVFVSGTMTSSSFRVANSGTPTTNSGGKDAFVLALSAGQPVFGFGTAGILKIAGSADDAMGNGIAGVGSTLYAAGGSLSTNLAVGILSSHTFDASVFGGFLAPLDSATGKILSTVALSNLAQTYDGAAKPATIITAPANVSTTVTYNGSATVPTNAGAYNVIATISDPGFIGSTSGTLTISKANATVTLINLNQIYDGGSKNAAATTSPPGLSVSFTYDGNATPPVNAGTYAVVGTVNDSNYQGSSSGTLTIGKAGAQVFLSNLSLVYNGQPQAPTANTSPAGLSVALTYDGDPTTPTNAGTYAAVATVTDPNYSGSTSNQFIISKAAATITLMDLTQTFDGAPKSAEATTNPPGLAVAFTYEGSSTAPTDPNTYALAATIMDTNYQGSASGTFTINAPPQPIATTTIAASVSTAASPNAQDVTLSATVLPAGGNGAISEGTITFQVLDGNNLIGSAVTSGTVSGGNVSVDYALPASLPVKVYTISATFNGTSNFVTSSDTTHTLTVILPGGTQPPGILPLDIDRNPAIINTPITITANAQSNSGLPLMYQFKLFNHGDPQPISTLQSGPSNVLQTTFPQDGDFDISVVVSDGFNASAESTRLEVFPLGPNTGAVAMSIFNAGAGDNGYSNGIDPIGLDISKSLGGALNIDPDLMGAVVGAGDSFLFTIPEQTRADPIRRLTAARFATPGIRVADLAATIGGVPRHIRLMIPVGLPETDPSTAFTDDRTRKDPMTFSLKGKLSFASVVNVRAKPIPSSLSVTAAVQMPTGLTAADIARDALEVGVSSVHTAVSIDAKGRVQASSITNTANFKSIKIKLPKFDRKTLKTAAGAQLTVSFTLIGGDLATKGFDTDGVRANGNGARNLQFAAVVAGMSYQGVLKVNVTANSDFGSVSGRSGK